MHHTILLVWHSRKWFILSQEDHHNNNDDHTDTKLFTSFGEIISSSMGGIPIVLPLPASVWEESIHPVVLSLFVLEFHYVLQSIESTAEVDLPSGGITIALVFACVGSPCPKNEKHIITLSANINVIRALMG